MVKHYTLTLTGSAQSLAAVLPTFVTSTTPDDVSYSFLSLQGGGANTGLIYVGGQGTTLTTSDYGFRMELPASTVPTAPVVVEIGGGPSIRLSEWQVLGTNTDKLHILLKA